MKRYLISSTVFSAVCFCATAIGLGESADPSRLTVHEWGTFTSIAAEDGSAVEWLPQVAPQDLPCFVERTRFENIKGILAGTVRMETPVLYFYAPEPTTVDVTVGFKEGLITEWYPRARVTPGVFNLTTLRNRWNGQIVWKGVKVLPGASLSLPMESGPSHYYAARETDAAPLRTGSQSEKFLFYRGVGRFAPPLSATLRNNQLEVRTIGGEPAGHVVWFENYGGSIRFGTGRGARATYTLHLPSGRGRLDALHQYLERILIDEGLYPREAAAMVQTWRDSWFEEGTRLFYIASRKSVDEILPLEIAPAPSAVERVFVGRMEILTPRTLDNVRRAVMTRDAEAFASYGRFLPAITQRITSSLAAADRLAFETALQRANHVYYGSLPATTLCR
jgi:hypothetical protein